MVRTVSYRDIVQSNTLTPAAELHLTLSCSNELCEPPCFKEETHFTHFNYLPAEPLGDFLTL